MKRGLTGRYETTAATTHKPPKNTQSTQAKTSVCSAPSVAKKESPVSNDKYNATDDTTVLRAVSQQHPDALYDLEATTLLDAKTAVRAGFEFDPPRFTISK
jgi:hypothetical protein